METQRYTTLSRLADWIRPKAWIARIVVLWHVNRSMSNDEVITLADHARIRDWTPHRRRGRITTVRSGLVVLPGAMALLKRSESTQEESRDSWSRIAAEVAAIHNSTKPLQ